MGSDDIHKKQKLAKSLERSSGKKREVRERILIVCEGKTEKLYFDGFRLVHVTVISTGYNSDSLVEKAIELRSKAKKDKEDYKQVWCVFDRDSCPPQNFNKAFEIAKNASIKIAYSNEAFEIWYLLHFHYYDMALSRNNYEDKLSESLGFKYEKTFPDMYKILKPHQTIAIRNAKKLLAAYTDKNPETDNPSTTVHELVTELNKWLKN